MSTLDLTIIGVLWIFLPGFLTNTFAMMWGKWLPKTGYGPWPIDGGRVHKDGNRLLGDGKTWNGLVGGSFTAGLLAMLMTYVIGGSSPSGVQGSATFPNLYYLIEGSWLDFAGPWFATFLLGALLGLYCLIGDMTGSFFKRRKGMKREGDISSKAPLLDTLPFAIALFALAMLTLVGTGYSSSSLLTPMLVLLVATPVLHRSFNLLGYWLGWKDVPY